MNKQVAVSPTEIIKNCEESFLKLNTFKLDFEREALFALQSVRKNDFIQSVASKNTTSLKNAVMNVAAIGISLNPALADAYLVPRDGAICLDISYKGLIKIATESGAIKWVKADIVYQGDQFTYKGPATMPDHHSDPFRSDRGEIKGVYCIAKTSDDDILVEVMSADDLLKIKQASPAWKKNSGPWINFEGEMSKKAVIKRASKTWPRIETDDRFREAVQMLNESEGYEFDGNHETEGYRADDEMLALVAPIATTILEMIGKGDHWEFGCLYVPLSEREKSALNTAKTKGGFFTQQQKQDLSDMQRRYFTERQEIEVTLNDSVDAICQAINEGDEMAVSELVNELNEKEFHVLCIMGAFDGEHLEQVENARE